MRLRELLSGCAASGFDCEDGFAGCTRAACEFEKTWSVFQAFDIQADGAGGFVVNEIFNQVAQFNVSLIADSGGHAEAGAAVLCMRNQ